MNCLLMHHRTTGCEAYDSTIASLVENLEKGGFKTFTQQTNLADSDSVLSADALTLLRGIPARESVLILQGDGVFASMNDIERCRRLHEKTGNVVVSVSEPEDHPCTLESFYEIITSGFVTRDAEGHWNGFIDETNTPVITVALEAGGAAICKWKRPTARPNDLLIQFFLIHRDKEESAIGPFRFNEPIHGLAEALCKQADAYAFSVSRTVEKGPYDVSMQYLPRNRDWDLQYNPRQLINRNTGKVIHGRQAFPEAYQIDTGVILGTAGDLADIDSKLESGDVKGCPVNITPPSAWQARQLAYASEERHTEVAEIAPVPASSEFLANSSANTVAKLSNEYQHAFRFSQAFTSLSAYTRKLCPIQPPVGSCPRGFIEQTGTLATKEMVSPRTVASLGDGKIVVADMEGNLHLFEANRKAEDVPHNGKHASYLFSDSGTLYACDSKDRSILRFDDTYSVEKVLDIKALAPESQNFIPLRAKVYGNNVVMMVRDAISKWTGIAEFSLDSPQKTFHLVESDSMLTPCAFAGTEDRQLIFENHPFGFWKRSPVETTPTLLKRNFLNDWVNSAVQGRDMVLLILRRGIMLVDQNASWIDPYIPFKSLSGIHAPYLQDSTDKIEPDGSFHVVDISSGQVHTLKLNF